MKRTASYPNAYKHAIGEYSRLIEEPPEFRSSLTKRQHADFLFHLPSILAKVDRMSMAHGLEIRVPMLSKDLVNFCFNLPDDAKRVGSKGKVVLRKTLAPRVPQGALQRAKAGFLPPVDRWFRERGAMYNVFAEHLDTAKKHGLEALNWVEVERFWQEHREGRQEAGFVLLSILQFINWRRQCKAI